MTGHYQYQPGSAHLAVGPGCGVLTPDAATALRLWPLINRGAPLAALLEEALADGLAQLPDLVLFEVDEEELRVVVRGKTGVQVQTADGDSVNTDGQAVRSWTEQLFTAPKTFGAGEAAADGLPLSGGVVMAAGFQWRVSQVAPRQPAERRDRPADGRDQLEPGPVIEPPATSVEPPATSVEPPATSVESDAWVPPLAPEGAPSVGTAADAPDLPQLRDTRIEPIDDSFEHLFESTIMRSVEDAAVRGAPEEDESFSSEVPRAAAGSQVREIQSEEAEPAEPVSVRPGDHDGSTIMAGQLASVLASTGDPAGQPPTSTGGPSSQARTPTSAARLSLVLSTGQTIALDRSVVIGRRPQVDRVSGIALPHLVTVPSPQQDISRSHVAIRPTPAGCVAVDLGSTNGSVIRRASGETVDLRGGASIDVQPGDVIDLGDGITAQLRGPA